MKKPTAKFSSPSTPEVSHDLPNFFTEAILINKYGALPEGSWRKGAPFAKDWGSILTKIKRIKKLGINDAQLAWLIKTYKVLDINYSEFGLLKWKVEKYFKWYDIEHFVTYYSKLHESLVNKSSSYIERTSGYKTKEAGAKKKTLSDILMELERDAKNESVE